MVLKAKSNLKNQSTSKLVEPEASASGNLKTAPSAKSKSPSRPKSPSRTKSPSRKKTPPRVKSPARTKSPVRPKSPARPRSPSRRSPARNKKDVSPPPLLSSTPKVPSPKARSPIRRSPGRKSPTRVIKPPNMENYITEKVQRPRRNNLDIDTDSDSAEGAFKQLEKSQPTTRTRTRRMEVQLERMEVKESRGSELSSFNLIKRVTSRGSQNPEEERIVHLKNFDKLGEFSDEDDTIHVRKSQSLERSGDFKQITEFGGPLCALFLMFTFPLSIILFHILCNEDQCSISLPDLKKYLLFSTYFELTSSLAFIAYATLLAVLSVIPFGGKKVVGTARQGNFVYTMNGFFSLIIIFLIITGLEIKNVPVLNSTVEHTFHLLIASLLFGLLLTVYAYVRSFYVPYSSLNIHVIGKSGIYAFFMGREVSPRIFNILDLKMYILRLTLIGSLLLDFAYFYKSVTLNWHSASQGTFDINSLTVNPTLVVFILIHSIYFLDGLIQETSWITSFEMQYEGFGYICGVGYLLYPFMTSTISKYIVDYNVRLPTWQLVLTTAIFIFGLLLYRGSNNQKDAFRKNPYNPALSHLETIPTTKGKKLICSGFWGVVRHPNYLGNIIICLTFVPFAWNALPVLMIIYEVMFLVHRSVRDNGRCRQKYGAAWDRYCSKVKYVLIPKVY